MSVLINFKICDNSKDCNGIKSCPTGAFVWDEEKKTIVVDESICINCGKCACCPVNAIIVTKTDEECERIKREIEEDPRTINDLFIDRYGASPIQEECITTEENTDNVLQSKRPFVLELYNEDSINCLLKSIPIKEILQEFDVESRYRKCETTTEKLLNIYNIKELPALLFFKEGNLIGKVEGYYEDENSEELFTKIKQIKESVNK